jgi:hypothetical protein
MSDVKCYTAIDKRYLDLASIMCDTYGVVIEIDQRITPNPFSGKRSFIIKVRKDNMIVDIQEGIDLNWNFDMLSRRLSFLLPKKEVDSGD